MIVVRQLRAGWRLARSAVHALHGLAIVRLRFGSFDATQRHAIVGWWARKLLRTMGIALQVDGAAHPGGTLLVANHISWLDIVAVHAVLPHARFVSRAEVKAWPMLAHLIEAGGTLYLERERKRDTLRVVHSMARALAAGDSVAVFPEGTPTDGSALLPFHANLLQAAIATATPVQPIALRFSDALRPRSPAVDYGGATTLGQSLWRVACADRLAAHVSLLAPRASAQADRRALAQALRADIVAALDAAAPLSGPQALP